MTPTVKTTPIEQPSKLETMFIKIAPILIVVAAILLVLALVQLDDTKYVVKETAAYTRVSNCIVAKVANTPTTQEDVEKCYIQVEKDSGISLERFDEQVNGESDETHNR